MLALCFILEQKCINNNILVLVQAVFMQNCSSFFAQKIGDIVKVLELLEAKIRHSLQNRSSKVRKENDINIYVHV